MITNTMRFVKLFSEAVDELLPIRTTPQSEEEAQSAEAIIAQQRKANIESRKEEEKKEKHKTYPPEITRT